MGKKSRHKPGPFDPKAMHRFNVFSFMPRYFPLFMFSIFMTIFSLATAASQASYTWFRQVEAAGEYQAMFLIAAAVVLGFGGFMMSRGRPWAVWILVGLLGLSFVVVLFTWTARTQGVDLMIFLLGLLFPLLGLLSLNSKLGREMREQFALLRVDRADARERIKQHQALEAHRETLRRNKAGK